MSINPNSVESTPEKILHLPAYPKRGQTIGIGVLLVLSGALNLGLYLSMDDADSFLLLFTILIPIGLATIWSAVWLWGPKILQREEDGLMIRSALSNKIVVRSFPDRSALQVEVKEQVVQTSRNAPPKKAWFTILKQPGGKSCDLMRTKDQAEAERVAEEVRGFLDAVAIK